MNQFYDLNKGQPLKKMSITLGSSDLPRFSCANHKLNLAVRHALSLHKPASDLINKLNACSSHIRRCIQKNREFRLSKCRLRLENLTRWSSAYLMLESIKRAYDKKMFDSSADCPVGLDEVELYLQILKPVYLLSISFQNSHSSIADTFPSRIFFITRC